MSEQVEHGKGLEIRLELAPEWVERITALSVQTGLTPAEVALGMISVAGTILEEMDRGNDLGITRKRRGRALQLSSYNFAELAVDDRNLTPFAQAQRHVK